MTMRVLWVSLGLGLLAVGGCSCDEEQSAEDKERHAREAVRTFYQGLEQESCEVISPLLVQDHTEADCQELVEELSHRGVELVEVESATVDGRDPDAVIVKVRIRDRGQVNEMLMRSEREGDAWKLRM